MRRILVILILLLGIGIGYLWRDTEVAAVSNYPPENTTTPDTEAFKENAPGDEYTEENPYWPESLDIDDLERGMVVTMVGMDFELEYVILSEPEVRDGYCYLDVAQNMHFDYVVFSMPCAELGLIPYEGEDLGWNEYNHLMPTGLTLAEEELQAIENPPTPEPDNGWNQIL